MKACGHSATDKAGAVTRRGGVELVFRRLVDHSQSRFALDGESDHDGKLAAPGDEFLRTVHRIDDPDATAREPLQVIFFLFGKNGVIRKARAEFFDNQAARRTIGSGDGIVPSLPFHGGFLRIVCEEDCAGAECEISRCLEFNHFRHRLQPPISFMKAFSRRISKSLRNWK